ncbi:MAG: hypothetical protein KatS3mg096_586 [Candidatus Parcubacteria bacterium]|nr:MAG: hypothetical protein KatS3mg096_586 [Candidatus Parcubacteria bacterium]
MATKSKNKVYHLTLRYYVTDVKHLSSKEGKNKIYTTEISVVNEFGRKRKLVGQSKSKKGSFENALSSIGSSVEIVQGKKGDKSELINKGDYIISRLATTDPVKFLQVYKDYTGNDSAKIKEYCSNQGKKVRSGIKLGIDEIGLSSFACRVKTVDDAKRNASDFKIDKEDKKPARRGRKPASQEESKPKPARRGRKPKKRKRKPASQTASTPKPARSGRKPASRSESKPKPARRGRKPAKKPNKR